MKRLDTADKLTGRKLYAIDVKLSGVLNAAIKHCPVYGGKLESFDEAKIRGLPGVRGVVKVSNASVAVVADTWWRAKTALDALPIVWDEGPNAAQSDATIAEHLKTGLTATATNGERANGDALKAIEGAAKKVEAVYGTPFLAHACMETMNCTAELHRAGFGRRRRGLGRHAERGGVARRAVGGVGPAAPKMRGAQARPRRRVRPPRRHAGLRP